MHANYVIYQSPQNKWDNAASHTCARGGRYEGGPWVGGPPMVEINDRITISIEEGGSASTSAGLQCFQLCRREVSHESVAME
ncbi:hypothetical protein EVAR_100142_1 [Eumeta japonica]|uniref:Uncharacterized protein n=1 Tax=Eumeta variegata TaxID=151549 RepID=A0A4C1ZX35_EUMVA|nr:hypothetical protein EVAR_100142_1 [Eumeta japonica]